MKFPYRIRANILKISIPSTPAAAFLRKMWRLYALGASLRAAGGGSGGAPQRPKGAKKGVHSPQYGVFRHAKAGFRTFSGCLTT